MDKYDDHYHMKKLWKNQWLIKKIDEKEGEELKQTYNHYLALFGEKKRYYE